jgi:hypothetical protein
MSYSIPFASNPCCRVISRYANALVANLNSRMFMRAKDRSDTQPGGAMSINLATTTPSVIEFADPIVVSIHSQTTNSNAKRTGTEASSEVLRPASPLESTSGRREFASQYTATALLISCS